MFFWNSKKRKSRIFSFLVLLVIVLQFSFFIYQVSARTEVIPGFSTEDDINPNETVIYKFSNNIILGISTDSFIHIRINYENRIANREIFLIVNNSSPISLNITSKMDLGGFNLSKQPEVPRRGGFQFQYRYNCIYQIKSNVTIENVTFRSIKNYFYGFSPTTQYSMVVFEPSQNSWQQIGTFDKFNESSSEYYLESSLSNLKAETDYYITFFELSEVFDGWFWVILIIGLAVAFGSIIILISKKDYFRYLRTRQTPIEKGAHRLTMEEVLENENRNKIIDLILNEPGIHFNELLRQTGLAAGNLVWHLDILETYKVIGKKRIGKFIAYFPYYQKNPVSNLDIELSKSKLTLEILEMIEKEPGLWNNLITKRFKVDHKTIRYHVNKLKELGLINFRKDGRKKKIYPNLDSEYFNKD
ncbi:MAG: winged helix-turn-helix transcriptional regulator [Candidatus Odinarchaeota archaeon]